MIPLPAGVRVWLATGHTDMRKGFPSLALQVQEILHREPLSGHLFCFRGRRGNLLKVIWHDGQGAHSDDADQPFQRIPISHSDRSRSVWCGVSAPLDAFLISVFSPGVKPG
jgi:hypothetical protein